MDNETAVEILEGSDYLWLRTTTEEQEALSLAIEALEKQEKTMINAPMVEYGIKYIAWYCAKHSCSECILAKGDNVECFRFNIPCDWIDWLKEGDR